MKHRVFFGTLLPLLFVALAAPMEMPVACAAEALELLAMVRTNNRTASLEFPIPPRQARVSELRIRSGSLAVMIEAVEIEFADGGHARARLNESLAPGRQSRPIATDAHRALSRVIVMKRPGLQPGETAIQLLGKIAP